MQNIKSIVNNTNDVFILTYWREEMPGLSENVDIYIDCGQTVIIPNDASIDEYMIESADYSDDLFKFRQNRAQDGMNYWIYNDQYKLTIEKNQLIVST